MEPLPGATRRAHEVAKRASHWVGGDSGAKREVGVGGVLRVWRTARRVLLPGARERRRQQRVLIRGRAERSLLQWCLDSAQRSKGVCQKRGGAPTEAGLARAGCAPNVCIVRKRRSHSPAVVFLLPPNLPCKLWIFANGPPSPQRPRAG